MSLLINCPTSKALFMCAVRDNKGVVRIPIESNELPGIQIEVKMGEPINPQLMSAAMGVLGSEKPVFHIEQEITFQMTFNSGEECTVYVGNYLGDTQIRHAEYNRLIDILRSFPTNENRKTLVKVFQYFSVGLNDDIKALTPEDLS